MNARTILRLLICIVTAMMLLTGITSSTHAAGMYMNSPVVISQLYGGAEGVNATYSSDYIELFNRGLDPVTLTGWSLQIAESGSDDWQATSLEGTLAPGQYYLIQLGTQVGGSDLPTPDTRGTSGLNTTSGKVALVRTTELLTEECPLTDLTLADLVGYGDESCAEVNPTTEMGATEALLRRDAGCVESDNNANDFALATPAPHNRTAPSENCRGPITVVSFTTTNEREYIDIRWETSMEENTRGFNLYRGTDTAQSPMRINPSEIPAYGGTGQINRYEHPDYNVETNVTYYYFLEEVDINGNRTVVEVRSILRERPSAVTLTDLNVVAAPVAGGVTVVMVLGVTLAAAWGWRRRQ